MAISSITGAAVPPTPPPQSRNNESRVEGTTPDGDRDRDDANQRNTVTQTSNTAQVTETLGNNINVNA